MSIEEATNQARSLHVAQESATWIDCSFTFVYYNNYGVMCAISNPGTRSIRNIVLVWPD